MQQHARGTSLWRGNRLTGRDVPRGPACSSSMFTETSSVLKRTVDSSHDWSGVRPTLGTPRGSQTVDRTDQGGIGGTQGNSTTGTSSRSSITRTITSGSSSVPPMFPGTSYPLCVGPSWPSCSKAYSFQEVSRYRRDSSVATELTAVARRLLGVDKMYSGGMWLHGEADRNRVDSGMRGASGGG
jgi:hypothetical protein